MRTTTDMPFSAVRIVSSEPPSQQHPLTRFRIIRQKKTSCPIHTIHKQASCLQIQSSSHLHIVHSIVPLVTYLSHTIWHEKIQQQTLPKPNDLEPTNPLSHNKRKKPHAISMLCDSCTSILCTYLIIRCTFRFTLQLQHCAHTNQSKSIIFQTTISPPPHTSEHGLAQPPSPPIHTLENLGFHFQFSLNVQTVV